MSAEIERIKVTCPNCEKTLVMKAELAGRRVKCPQCETGFTAPGGNSAPAPKPVLAAAERPARSAPVTVQSSGVQTTPVRPRSWTPPANDDAEVDEPKPKKRKKAKRTSRGGGALGPGLIRGIIFGGVAAVVSAGGWALVGAVTGMEIGWLAWGVGVLCGIAVAVGSQESDTIQGVVAAACAAGGILLGKFMLLYFVFLPKAAAAAGVPVELVKEILAANGGYATIFKDMFSPMDLLFIGLAIISAFKLGSGASSGD